MGHIWPLLKWVVLFEAGRAEEKVGLSLKLNQQIKLSLSKSLLHVHGISLWMLFASIQIIFVIHQIIGLAPDQKNFVPFERKKREKRHRKTSSKPVSGPVLWHIKFGLKLIKNDCVFARMLLIAENAKKPLVRMYLRKIFF